MSEAGEKLTIGGVARRTGLTVRALRHYDRLGLLVPAQRTPSGYRLYGEGEIQRLQKIVVLKQFGLSLDQIQRTLDVRDLTAGPGSSKSTGTGGKPDPRVATLSREAQASDLAARFGEIAE